MYDSFFEDIEKMFEQMDHEFQRMEQAMFPVQQFQIVMEQQPEPQIPAGMKKIPYEGPAENC